MLLWLKYSNPLVQYSLQIPLSFYHVDEQQKISSPEYVTVLLQAQRSDLYLTDFAESAIHIDAQQLKKGMNQIFITEKDICLPEAMTVLNYSPRSVEINIA
jgi:hypothetical protein